MKISAYIFCQKSTPKVVARSRSNDELILIYRLQRAHIKDIFRRIEV